MSVSSATGSPSNPTKVHRRLSSAAQRDVLVIAVCQLHWPITPSVGTEKCALYLLQAPIVFFLPSTVTHVCSLTKIDTASCLLPVYPTRHVSVSFSQTCRRVRRDFRQALLQWLRRSFVAGGSLGSIRGSGCSGAPLSALRQGATQSLGLEGTGR